jgi:hypothetical protein
VTQHSIVLEPDGPGSYRFKFATELPRKRPSPELSIQPSRMREALNTNRTTYE